MSEEAFGVNSSSNNGNGKEGVHLRALEPIASVGRGAWLIAEFGVNMKDGAF